MDRILMMIAAPAYADAAEALLSARAMAAHPERLAFGLSLEAEPTENELQAMAALGSVQFLCPAADIWRGAEALWKGEERILIGHRAMRFEKGWDRVLMHLLHQCQTKAGEGKAALTGYLPRLQDPIDAVCPVAAESFSGEGWMHFHRGAPLRYAASPQQAAFVHPDFCFAPSAFFLEPSYVDEPVFLRAYRGQWQIFTLNRSVIRLQWDEPVPPLDISRCEGGRVLKQFEQKAGLRFDKRQLSAMARQGMVNGEMHFPVRVPFRVKMQELLRAFAGRRSKVNPLCVTAQLTLPQPPPNLPEEYLGWFEHLTKMKNLALLCYADPENIRRIAPIHPNVLEYKRRYGLPVQVEGLAELNMIKLSKPFLLSTSREKFLTHSHYVWMDFGMLRYPVWEHAWPDWTQVCTGKIVLAAVNGQPDLSMFVLPERMVLPLCREIALRCRSWQELDGSLPAETDLWMTLMREKPEWFDVRPASGFRALFTMLFPPEGSRKNAE